MNNRDCSIVLAIRIAQILEKAENQNIYKKFFAKYNMHYDLKNLNSYSIYEIATLTINHKGNLYELVDTTEDLADVCTFVAYCYGLMYYIGALEK